VTALQSAAYSSGNGHGRATTAVADACMAISARATAGKEAEGAAVSKPAIAEYAMPTSCTNRSAGGTVSSQCST